jgi:hypothetical protein
VIVALACLAELARLTAVTVTIVVEVTLGAVKRPAGVIVPAVADQLAAVLLVFVTVAVNWRLLPDAIAQVLGDTVMLTSEFVAGGALCDPNGKIPQEVVDAARSTMQAVTKSSQCQNAALLARFDAAPQRKSTAMLFMCASKTKWGTNVRVRWANVIGRGRARQITNGDVVRCPGAGLEEALFRVGPAP